MLLILSLRQIISFNKLQFMFCTLTCILMEKLCTGQQLYRPLPPGEETQILGRSFSNAVLFFCKEFELPYRLRRIQHPRRSPRLREGPSFACSSTQRFPGLGRSEGRRLRQLLQYLRRQQLLWLFWAFQKAQRHRQIPFCGDTPTNTASGLIELLTVIHTDSQ